MKVTSQILSLTSLIPTFCPANTADLASTYEIAQRSEHFLDWRFGVEAVQLVQIDVVGSEPPQARVDRLQQMKARRADVVRPGAESERETCILRLCKTKPYAGLRYSPLAQIEKRHYASEGVSKWILSRQHS